MKKILALAIVFVSVLIVSVSSTSKSTNAFTSYTATWTNTNVYDSNTFAIAFTGLDVSVSYRWTIQMVDPVNGKPFFDIGHYTHVPGTTVDAFVVGPDVVQPYVGDWPFQFTGPFQIKDDHGQVVMKGFVAPDPDLYGGDWRNGTGTNAAVDKVIAGSSTHQGACLNPVYNPYFGSWNYEPSRPCSSGVQDEHEFAIMHYNLDCATYQITPYTTESYRFYTYDGTEIFSVDLLELLNYNSPSGIPGGCGGGFTNVWESFIVLNTSGDDLPFIDNLYAENTFTTGDNPMRWDFEPNSYYIQKRDAASAHVSDGESPFFVSNADAGVEWSISIGGTEVSDGARMQMVFKQNTPEIWDDYNGGSLCQNDLVTWTDTNIYAFTSERNYKDVVPAAPAAGDFIECAHEPQAISTVDMLSTEAIVIVESETYNVVEGAATLEEITSELLSAWKLDTDTGYSVALASLLAISMFIIAVSPLRASVFAYLFLWSAIGSIWVLFAPTSDISKLMFVIITVVLWLLLITGSKLGGRTDAGFE